MRGSSCKLFRACSWRWTSITIAFILPVHFFFQQQGRIMILRPLLLLIIGYFSFFSFVEISAAECAPDGSIEFVCGPISPEDLAIIPDSEWLIASGMEDEGFLYMVNTDDHSSLAVYPPAISEPATAMAPYQACPGVVDQGFRPHGLSFILSMLFAMVPAKQLKCLQLIQIILFLA